MNIFTLTELIRKGEGEHLEFKRTAESAVGKTICAFLNTAGGQLIIGVDNKGNIVGCELDAQDKISNFLSVIAPRPKITVEKLIIEKRQVVILTVPKSDRLHTFGNTGYLRIGSTTRELQLDEIVEKAAESLLLRFDEALCIDAKESDLSVQILRNYLNKRKEVRNVKPPREKGKHLWALIRASSKGHVTNAGVIFFSDHPEKFHPQAQLRIIEFAGNDMQTVLEEQTLSGNIWKISDSAGAVLEKKISKEVTIKGFDRIVSPRFPLEALREAVNNALIHRNYFDRADVRIFLFPDRLEIINPGSFPPDVTPQIPAHRPRNPVLSQYFYDIGKIEKYGSGLFKMRQLCREGGYPEPEFILSAGQTKVIFNFIPSRIRESIKNLDQTDQKIIEAIRSKNWIGSGELMKLVSLSRPGIVARLNKLMIKKIIQKCGNGRSIRYTLA
ncbi:putative DNA binding domain-containing protein [Candidatus Micrarchaeota archaeon]|nr:putative DNA binding domain-containing protein [Candidatus Micrarchaeota archaeon]